MVEARDCGTDWATVQRADSGYVGEFSSYTVSVEQSDRVPRTGLRDSVHQGPGTGDEGWTIHADGSLRYRGQIVVPQLTDLREEILREFHCSRFAMHSGGTKMYQDLRRQYYWSGMKRHVRDFVRRCLTCQQVKAEHQKPAGLLQPLDVAE